MQVDQLCLVADIHRSRRCEEELGFKIFKLWAAQSYLVQVRLGRPAGLCCIHSRAGGAS